MSERDRPPVVGVVGGSRSDFPILEDAIAVLGELGVPAELKVVSAHRTPDQLFRYAEEAAGRGIRVIIAGAGGAAHLPGMLAAKTALPVIGVPIPTQHLGGLESLLPGVESLAERLDRWDAQFVGKERDARLTFGREIHGVVGATLSARAATDALRRMFAYWEVLLRPAYVASEAP